MIVVEGPDGAGKTTLLKNLSQAWGLPIAPRVVGKDTKAMASVSAWVEANVAKGWQPMLFDRHRLISEPVYGPLLRGVNQDPHFLDLSWMMTQLGRFYAGQPLIIYCIPRLDVVINNCMNDTTNDNSAVLDHILPIYSAYVARAALDRAMRPGTTLIYDYEASAASEIPHEVYYKWAKIIDARRDW